VYKIKPSTLKLFSFLTTKGGMVLEYRRPERVKGQFAYYYILVNTKTGLVARKKPVPQHMVGRRLVLGVPEKSALYGIHAQFL